MKKLAFSTIAELLSYLKKKEVSREEVLSYFLDRFKKYNGKIGAALEVFDKDSILKNSSERGVIAGIPGVAKDNICQKNRKTTCASKILENFVSPYDSTVSARLKNEGGFLVGSANMDEFAMGSSTETSAFQQTCNPWDTERVAGGSSGGSAAAVAAGLVPWALGSDTGGSVRQPAGFCGIVGLKPTYGLVSRYGLVAYASSLDQIGIHTRTVFDNALILSVIGGHDSKDSSSLAVGVKDYTCDIEKSTNGDIKIGILQNTFDDDGLMDPEVKAAFDTAVETFKKLGFKIKNVELPSLKYGAATYFILSRAEAASNLARFDGVRYGLRPHSDTLNEMYCDTRHDGFGREVKCRILVGNYVLSVGHAGEFYDNARKVQRLIRREFHNAFEDVDVLLTPTQAITAFKFGTYKDNPLQMDLTDAYTAPINLAGIPAMSIPCGFSSNNLPIGLQLIGPHLSECLLYRIAHKYEQETQWYKNLPKNLD